MGAAEIPPILADIRDPASRRFAVAATHYIASRFKPANPSTHPSRAAIAAHEAGHAIVMSAFGFQLSEITLWKENAGWSGMAYAFQPAPSDGIGPLLTKMVVAVAGSCGERLLLGSMHTGADELGFALAASRSIGERFGVNGMVAMLTTLRLADEVLKQNEKLARRLQQRLLRDSALYGQPLKRMLRGIPRRDIAEWPELAERHGEVDPRLEELLRAAGGFALEAGFGPGVEAKATAAREAIASALDRHQRGAVMFSGGKDSVVLAHLAEPFKDRIELVWVNTQGHFPHSVEFVRSYAERFKLVELTSNYAERFVAYGPPSMIVPIYNTRLNAAVEFDDQERFVVSDWISCCSELRWKPMADYLLENRDITLVINGQRKDEGHALRSGGAEQLVPLWNWSNAEVHEYARAHGLHLQEQYAAGCNSSFDCGAVCTARLDLEHRRWMAKRYPSIGKDFDAALQVVYGTVMQEWEKLKPSLADITVDEPTPGITAYGVKA